MDQRRIELESGPLSLAIHSAELPLDELCGFASRANRKRGFLFVSKVLGKHIPVRPSVMEDVFKRLASGLERTSGPTVVVGLAETATGLAHGVYEQLIRQTDGDDALFMHTTRHRFARPLALEFQEPHSHAPEHRLYWPDRAEHVALLREATNLVLVDDELSTGVTLGNLAAALREVCPRLALLQIVSLTNWMSADDERRLRERVGLPVHFVQLLRGTYAFAPTANEMPAAAPPAARDAEAIDAYVAANHGRFGLQAVMSLAHDAEELTRDLRPQSRILVLGTGEFLYPPYLLARELERQGFDVRYQSTTRSPIRPGPAIASVCRFADHAYEGIANYVYNVLDQAYDRIVIGYEVAPLPADHRLAGELGAVPLLFGAGGVTLHPAAAAR